MAALSGDLDLGLDGRVALVTGAAGGIGRRVAELLAEAGARVFGVDRDAGALEDARANWAGEGHGSAVADLGAVADCKAAVSAATALHGRLDILVAVHALLIRRELDAVDEAEFDRQMAVNARAQFFLAQAALEPMRAARFGRIVLFTSPAGTIGSVARASAYAMTKGAALGLARSIARRYGPEGVTCNLVSPGSTDTAMLRSDLGAADLEAIRQSIPLRRLADPAEVALGAVYLASRWASYVNGHLLTIDGGSTMGA